MLVIFKSNYKFFSAISNFASFSATQIANFINIDKLNYVLVLIAMSGLTTCNFVLFP